MIGLAILLAGAAVAQAVARWLTVPATPFVLLVGFVLGQAGLLPPEILQEALLLGLTFLMLVLGIELNPRRLLIRPQRHAALQVGLVQFLVLGVAGTVTALALGLGALSAFHIGVALAASSTLVVVRLLQREGRMFEPFGRLVIGVLLVQDALVIIGMPIMLRATDGVPSMLIGMAGTVAMIALAMACMRWVVPHIARLQEEDEELLVVGLSIPFVFIGLAAWLGLPLAAGAFVGGFALSPFPASGLIRGQLASVGDFFTPVFFLALGGILVTPDPGIVLRALVLAAVVLLLTPVLVGYLTQRAGFEARTALESGLILSQTSELSLVLGLHALLARHLGEDAFTMLVLVTMMTMVITPYLLSERLVHFLLRLLPVRRQGARPAPASGHVVLLGCGSGGMPLLDVLLFAGEDVVVVDDDPEIINRLREADIPCVHGDASNEDVLRRAGAHQARVISSTIRRPRDNACVLALMGDRPVLVRVFEEHDAEWVEQNGGIPVLYSEAAADEFIDWFTGEGDYS